MSGPKNMNIDSTESARDAVPPPAVVLDEPSSTSKPKRRNLHRILLDAGLTDDDFRWYMDEHAGKDGYAIRGERSWFTALIPIRAVKSDEARRRMKLSSEGIGFVRYVDPTAIRKSLVGDHAVAVRFPRLHRHLVLDLDNHGVAAKRGQAGVEPLKPNAFRRVVWKVARALHAVGISSVVVIFSPRGAHFYIRVQCIPDEDYEQVANTVIEWAGTWLPRGVVLEHFHGTAKRVRLPVCFGRKMVFSTPSGHRKSITIETVQDAAQAVRALRQLPATTIRSLQSSVAKLVELPVPSGSTGAGRRVESSRRCPTKTQPSTRPVNSRPGHEKGGSRSRTKTNLGVPSPRTELPAGYEDQPEVQRALEVVRGLHPAELEPGERNFVQFELSRALVSRGFEPDVIIPALWRWLVLHGQGSRLVNQDPEKALQALRRTVLAVAEWTPRHISNAIPEPSQALLEGVAKATQLTIDSALVQHVATLVAAIAGMQRTVGEVIPLSRKYISIVCDVTSPKVLARIRQAFMKAGIAEEVTAWSYVEKRATEVVLRDHHIWSIAGLGCSTSCSTDLADVPLVAAPVGPVTPSDREAASPDSRPIAA